MEASDCAASEASLLRARSSRALTGYSTDWDSVFIAQNENLVWRGQQPREQDFVVANAFHHSHDGDRLPFADSQAAWLRSGAKSQMRVNEPLRGLNLDVSAHWDAGFSGVNFLDYAFNFDFLREVVARLDDLGLRGRSGCWRRGLAMGRQNENYSSRQREQR